MCNPAALAGVGLLGGVIQGFGAAQEKNNNAQSNDMAAAGLDRDIAAEAESSAFEVASSRANTARTQGSARAGFAANGLALSGSVSEVLQQSAEQGDLDVAAIRWNSKIKQDTMGYQRDVYKFNAGTERAAAPLAFIAPVIGGVAKFGGSFG